MRALHKYNLWVSSGMFLLFILAVIFLGENGTFIYGVIFGYIYSCFWSYIYDLGEEK